MLRHVLDDGTDACPRRETAATTAHAWFEPRAKLCLAEGVLHVAVDDARRQLERRCDNEHPRDAHHLEHKLFRDLVRQMLNNLGADDKVENGWAKIETQKVALEKGDAARAAHRAT